MSKRLQVLLDEREWATLRRTARRHQMTTAAWVRRSLRAAQRNEVATDPGKKLTVVRLSAGYSFPTADIDTMLAEIDRGRG